MTPYHKHDRWQHLLAAIRAAPDDDLPRLVAADFVEENGDAERAELIRIECELARKPDRASCDRCRKEWGRRRFSSYPVDMGWCDNCRTKGPFWPDVERSLALRRRRQELRDKWQRPWTEADERAGLNTYGDRGFVTRVSAPLAVLHGGGECPICWWSTEEGSGHIYANCPTCHGTGCTPGVLGPLLSREPVTAAGIVVTDKVPVSGRADDIHYWAWVDAMGEHANPRHYLPSSLFRHLEWCENDIWRNATVKAYKSADAARLAIGEALFRLHSSKSEVLT